MANTRPTTQLDFDQLKADLIDFIKTNPTFTDYNFEGSALNTIMDILAYNTHNNAYYANMLHGESFIDTAQKRNSVVSRAKEFGYRPRSVTGSTAYVNLSVNTGPGNTQSILLTRGTKFTSTNDTGSYTFNVVDDQLSEYSDGRHLFSNVRLVCGTLTRNRFTVNPLVNPNNLFTVPNKDIDTSTLKVYVKNSANSLELFEYKLADNVYENKPTDQVYFLQETYNGFFQIYFGENVIGTQPPSGSIIEINYVVAADRVAADLCKVFQFNGNILNSIAVGVETIQQSFGGADKESMESIKTNAVKSRSAKERAVTTTDYELALMEKFNFIKSVCVWGGEKNNPPVYGKVFVSIQPTTGYTLTETVKREVIAPVVKSLSMLTVSPEFVDPDYIDIELTTSIKFNPNKTVSNQNLVTSGIKQLIVDYIAGISRFNGDYLESALSRDILLIDPGVVSVDIDKKIGFTLQPTTGVISYYEKYIGNQLISGSIESTKFNIFSSLPVTVSIKEIADSQYTQENSNGTVSKFIRLGLFTTTDNRLISNVGTVNLSQGIFKLSFNVYSYITDTRIVAIRFLTVNDDFNIKNNQILNLNPVSADTIINLQENNRILTENYVK